MLLLFIACNEWFEFKKLIGHCVRSYDDKEWSIAKIQYTDSRLLLLGGRKKIYIDWKSVVFFSWAVASSAFELNFLWPNEQFIHCSIQWAIAVIPSFFAYTFYIRSFENALQFNGQISRIRKKPQSIYRRKKKKNVENYSLCKCSPVERWFIHVEMATLWILWPAIINEFWWHKVFRVKCFGKLAEWFIYGWCSWLSKNTI